VVLFYLVFFSFFSCHFFFIIIAVTVQVILPFYLPVFIYLSPFPPLLPLACSLLLVYGNDLLEGHNQLYCDIIIQKEGGEGRLLYLMTPHPIIRGKRLF